MSELHDKLPTPLLATRMVDGVELLTDEGLFDACGVRIGFTARRGGVSRDPFASLNTASHVGDEIDDVEQVLEMVVEGLSGDVAGFHKLRHGDLIEGFLFHHFAKGVPDEGLHIFHSRPPFQHILSSVREKVQPYELDGGFALC